MRLLKKIFFKIYAIQYSGFFRKAYNFISPKKYMKSYVNYLRRCGVNIEGEPNFIANDVYFDGHDYSLISIGNDTVISMKVTLLTHDYSIARGVQTLQEEKLGIQLLHHIF